MNVIVIGSGMSGLVSAAYLARAGHQVTVYEQFPTIGGVTATLKEGGNVAGFMIGARKVARRILGEEGPWYEGTH